jgi:hypothetical protein
MIRPRTECIRGFWIFDDNDAGGAFAGAKSKFGRESFLEAESAKEESGQNPRLATTLMISALPKAPPMEPVS